MNPENPTEKSLPESILPYAKYWPFLAGILSGICLRLLYSGQPGDIFSAMAWPFIYLSPFIVGAVTVYFAERQKRRTWSYYFVTSIMANLFYVLGTLLILIEGAICAIIILPLFGALGGIGGLIMGAVCRITNWPRQALCVTVLLPLVLGGTDDGDNLPIWIETIERSVLVSATPETIWNNILNAPAIAPEHIEKAWLHSIGVPLPLSGKTSPSSQGLVRRVTMGKNIYFDELITDSRQFQYLRWVYQFHEDSFPPYALDEHVVLGGHYFDIIDTSYSLSDRNQSTLLTVKMTYRVSTRFNWYAQPVADLLIGNLGESNLAYYKNQSEQ